MPPIIPQQRPTNPLHGRAKIAAICVEVCYRLVWKVEQGRAPPAPDQKRRLPTIEGPQGDRTRGPQRDRIRRSSPDPARAAAVS